MLVFFDVSDGDFLLDSGLQARTTRHELEHKLSVLIRELLDNFPKHLFGHLFFLIRQIIAAGDVDLGGCFQSSQIYDGSGANSALGNLRRQ